jgi:uncharacterized membrane protein YphA (DoxX/SURF4 family)
MRNKIIYWISTLWLGLGMISTATVQLLKLRGDGTSVPPGGIESIHQLGYPAYFLTLIGIWKIVGVVAILIPKFPLVKEWAYAGFFFAMTGAIFSHIAVGDSFKEIFPSSLLVILTVVSWYFRPVSRKIIAVVN